MAELLEQIRQRLCRIANKVEAGTSLIRDINHEIQVTMDMLVQCLSIPGIENASLDDAIKCVSKAFHVTNNIEEEYSDPSVPNFKTYTQNSGRPSYDIPEQLLEYYQSNCFSIPRISDMVGDEQ